MPPPLPPFGARAHALLAHLHPPDFAGTAPNAAWWVQGTAPDGGDATVFTTDAATVWHALQHAAGAFVPLGTSPANWHHQHPDGRWTDGRIGQDSMDAFARLLEDAGDGDAAESLRSGHLDAANVARLLEVVFHRGVRGSVWLLPGAQVRAQCNAHHCPILGTPSGTVHYAPLGAPDAPGAFDAFATDAPAPTRAVSILPATVAAPELPRPHGGGHAHGRSTAGDLATTDGPLVALDQRFGLPRGSALVATFFALLGLGYYLFVRPRLAVQRAYRPGAFDTPAGHVPPADPFGAP